MTLPDGTPSHVVIAGCGYVGTALAERLAAAGFRVTGLRRSGGPTRSFEGGGSFAVRSAPLADREALTSACEGAEYAVFAAAADASTDEAYRQTYVDGLRAFVTALRAARAPVRRLVFTSSTGVYGQSQGEWVDEASPTEPRGFTGQRMLEAEGVLSEAPFSTVVLRLGGIYGPGRARMIAAVRRGEARLSPGAGPITNRIHRDDAAGAIAHLLSLDGAEAVYLGVDSEPASRDDVLRFLARSLGLPALPIDGSTASRLRGGEKRCNNARLRASGYTFVHPTYRDGYGALLAAGEGATAD